MFTIKSVSRLCSFVLVAAFLLALAGPAGIASASPSVPALPTQSALDAQSTTGPTPPPQALAADSLNYAPGSSATLISDVPVYLWRHGCGPTAAGMVLGYWDAHGFPALISGSAATETAAVDQAIASSLGARNHYTDYALPLDDYTAKMRPDRSEPPVGDEHANNSVADFMHTSQSAYKNRYGWSFFSDVRSAFTNYIQYVNSGIYVASSTKLFWDDGSLNWDTFKAQIDAGQPMVFLVDSNADGSTDHFIPVFGYDDSTGVEMYAAYNTWDTNLHWYEFGPMTDGKPWGVYGGITLSISAHALSSETFNSIPQQDGWIVESGENSNTGKTINNAGTALRIGDSSARTQYRSILSFSTGADLPDDAVITNVTLNIKKQSVVGSVSPITALQGFIVDLKRGTFGSAALQATDFQAAANQSVGPFKPTPVASWYSIDLTGAKASINKSTTASGLTQIRLRFKLDDNNNAVANILNLYSGNAADPADLPQLVITYYVPTASG